MESHVSIECERGQELAFEFTFVDVRGVSLLFRSAALLLGA